MKFRRLLEYAYRRGIRTGYKRAERMYRHEIDMREKEIESLRRRNTVEYEETQKKFDNLLDSIKITHQKEIESLKMRIISCQKAYKIFSEDLFEFSSMITGQSAEANAVAIKGAELLSAVQALNDRIEMMTRRIEKKDKKIKQLLYLEAENVD